MQKFASVAQDTAGNAVPSAMVSVYGSGLPTLAPIYSANNYTALANPFLTDSYGGFAFYAQNGRYDIKVTKTGYTFDPTITSDIILYDPGSGTTPPSTPVLSPGFISGLILSNSAGDLTNDISINIGDALSDDPILTNQVTLSLPNIMIKSLDAVWAAGTNQGGRISTEALADGTWHVHLFKRSGGTIDLCYSQGLTPTLPDGGTKKRRIGSILRSSGVIAPFLQNEDYFYLTAPSVNDHAALNSVGQTTAFTSTPYGLPTIAILNVKIGNHATLAVGVFIIPVSAGNPDPASLSCSVWAAAPNTYGSGMVQCLTNTSRQVNYRLTASDASTLVQITTMGWIDTRGK